jgi:integrase
MGLHRRSGEFVRVGENLYRYSTSKTYYAVYRKHGRLLWKSLKTTDRELAKRKLKDEIANAGRIDQRQEKMSLGALLGLFEDHLNRFDVRTRANRRYILNTFKQTWKYGLDLAVRDITLAQLDGWLAQHSARIKRTSLNAYILFVRQLFELAIAARAIAESPAVTLKMLKPEEPIRQTPTWLQFQNIVEDIRKQRFNADAEESADLVEFMGLAGVGLSESANLKGEHIDFEAKKIWLFRSKTDTGYAIPIFPQLKNLLERFKATGRLQNSQPVFKVRDPKKALTNACNRLKLPHFPTRSPHVHFAAASSPGPSNLVWISKPSPRGKATGTGGC